MVSAIDVKKLFYVFFIIFIKTRFLTFFIFRKVSQFLMAKFFIILNMLNSTKPAKHSCIKRLLRDRFNMADRSIQNPLMKSRSLETLSCIDSNFTEEFFIRFD